MDYLSTLLLSSLVINRYSSKINSLYTKTNRVPIKNHNRSKRNNHKSTFIYIYIYTWKVSILAFIQNFARATTNRERASYGYEVEE